MNGIYKDKQSDGNDIGGLDFEIPRVDKVISGLEQAIASKEELRKEHEEANEEDRKKGRKPKKKRVTQICCCGDPHCGIGPMTEMEREGD